MTYLRITVLALALFACFCREHQAETIPSNGIEKRLRPGDRHRYHRCMGAGEYAVVQVEQCGVDIVMVLTAEKEEDPFTIDRPIGKIGFEFIPLIADKPRCFDIEVRAFDAGGDGYYLLSVPEHRPLARGDQTYADGVHRYLEAYSLIYKFPRQTLEMLLPLTGVFESLGDLELHAEVIHRIGRIYFDLDKIQAALVYQEEALALFRQRDDPVRMATALAEIGRCYEKLTLVDRVYLEPAMMNNYRSLFLLQRLQSPGILEEPGDAENLPAPRLDYIRARPNTKYFDAETGKTLNNIGLAYIRKKEYQIALAYLQEALVLARKLGDTGSQSSILNNMNLCYRPLGEPDIARNLQLQSYSLLLETGREDSNKMFATMQNLGDLELMLGNFSEAEAWYTDLLEWAEIWEDQSLASAYNSLAELYLDESYPDQAPDLAVAYLEKALELEQTEIADKLHYNMGRAFLRRYTRDEDPDRLAMACSHMDQAYQLARNRSTENLAQTLCLQALVKHELGEEGAIDLLDEAISIFENIRGRLLDPDFRGTYLGSRQYIFELKIRWLLEEERNIEALAVFDGSRARTLLEVLGQGGLTAGTTPDLSLFEAYWRQKIHLADLKEHRQHAGDRLEEKIAASRNKLNLLAAKIRKVERAVPEWENRLDTTQILELIPEPETLLLAYAIDEKKSHAWALDSEGLATFAFPPRAVIGKKVRLASAVIAMQPGQRTVNGLPRKPGQALAELSRWLLQPANTKLRGKKRVVIIAGESLQLLPFGVLPWRVPVKAENSPRGSAKKGRVLLDEMEVVYLPSLSAYAALKAGSMELGSSGLGRLALFADPETARPIPGTSREAQTILQLSKGRYQVRPFLGKDCNRENAISTALAQYQIIHFATHGIIDQENPGRSHLILSPSPQTGGKNEALFLKDIMRMRLRAGLVVLSACDTAMGKSVRGEGLISLARGFMQAGVPRVMGTLWSISDAQAAELMGEFYQQMLKNGATPVAAMRHARLALRENPRYRDPFFWGGFIAIGDWH